MANENDINTIKAKNNPADQATDDAFASIADKIKPRQLAFSDKELEVLRLYDTIQERRLENAMMRAQIDEGVHENDEADAQALEAAESEHLQQRAAYSLSENIIKSVLQADPLLKAIHAGETASPVESALQPLIDQRDILSLVQTNLSSRLQSINNDMVLVRAQNLDYTYKNRALSKDIVRLGKQSEATADKIEDPALKDRLEVLRTKTREEKRQYRIIKSLASGVVAGSGFDWAADDELRDIVLDDED